MAFHQPVPLTSRPNRHQPSRHHQIKRRYQKPEEMTLTDEWHANYDNPKSCALCGKNLESGNWFYVSVRAGLREKYICKACLIDRKDDKTEKKWG